MTQPGEFAEARFIVLQSRLQLLIHQQCPLNNRSFRIAIQLRHNRQSVANPQHLRHTNSRRSAVTQIADQLQDWHTRDGQKESAQCQPVAQPPGPPAVQSALLFSRCIHRPAPQNMK